MRARRFYRSATVSFLAAAFSSLGLMAQEAGWKTDKLDSGRIVVKSRVTEIKNDGGDKAALIEYEASTVEEIGLESCVALLKNAARHKDWIDGDKSESIRILPEGDSLIYYGFKGIGPVKDSDCAARMSFREPEPGKHAVFTVRAAPELLEERGRLRFKRYDVKYDFTDLGGGKVGVVVTATILTVVNVPFFMVKAAYPGAATDALKKLLKQAHKARG